MQDLSADAQLRPVVHAIGCTVSAVARTFYEVGGASDESNGGLELSFDAGQTIYLDSGSDGDSLRIGSLPWSDPFVGPLSPENQAYVASSGKWSRVDVSSRPHYANVVGEALVDFEPSYLDDGRLHGITMRFEDGTLIRAETVADELVVDIT